MPYCKAEREYLANLKAVYEGIAERKYSNRTWERIRLVIKVWSGCQSYFCEEYEIALKTYALATRLKRQLNIKSGTDRFIADKTLVIVEKIPGTNCKTFIDFLFKYLSVEPPRSTKYWFFKKIGGYQPEKQLTDTEKIILTFSVINWKINLEGVESVEHIKKKLSGV